MDSGYKQDSSGCCQGIDYYNQPFSKGKSLHCISSPFDVRLPIISKKNEDIYTVVQPDISVICDKSKLDDAGCIGAPDLIVEILSPSNNKKELQLKYEVYLESEVKEYWVLQPIGQNLLIYTLDNGKYILPNFIALAMWFVHQY